MIVILFAFFFFFLNFAKRKCFSIEMKQGRANDFDFPLSIFSKTNIF